MMLCCSREDDGMGGPWLKGRDMRGVFVTSSRGHCIPTQTMRYYKGNPSKISKIPYMCMV